MWMINVGQVHIQCSMLVIKKFYSKTILVFRWYRLISIHLFMYETSRGPINKFLILTLLDEAIIVLIANKT